MVKIDNTNPKRIEDIRLAAFSLNSTCQLYQWINDDSKLFMANGCVILFEHNSSYYCFSNSHVLGGLHLGKTFFLLKDGTSMTVGGEHLFSLPLSFEDSKDDYLDMAVVKLNPNVVERILNNGNTFLKINQLCTLSKLSKSDVLLIAGYPASKTKVDVKEMRMKFNPLLLLTAPYLRKLKNKIFTQGFHHIVEFPINSFRETSTGQKIRAPQPHGISGSGLWLYPIRDRQNFTPLLIGILSEYHEKNAIVIATKIDFYLDLLRQKFDASIRLDGIKADLDYES